MKTLKKNYRLLFLTFILSAFLFGCSNSSAEKKQGQHANASSNDSEVTTLRYNGDVGQVSYPELAEALGYLGDIKLDYQGVTKGGPESIQLVATNELDFGRAFNGAIIKGIDAGAKIKTVVAGYGSDELTNLGVYTLEESDIDEAKDFIGKTVGINTFGAHYEVALKSYLQQNGLTEAEIKEVGLVTIPVANSEQALRNKQIDAVVLGGTAQDYAVERGGIRKIFTDYELFGAFTAGSHFFTEKFIEENPNTVKQFVKGVAEAVNWAATSSKEEVVAKYVEIIENRDRKETTDTAKLWKSIGLPSEYALITDEEIQMWIDWLSKNKIIKNSSIKPSDIYTNEYNPHH